jgi:hypothetical protein
VAGLLQLCPAASELLLSPELLSCLSIMLVVIVLGLDMSTDRPDAYKPSEEQRQAGSRGSGLVSGGRLDSLTPLSCGLFDALGVPKGTVLHAAMVAHSQGFSTLLNFKIFLASYNSVLDHQVRLGYWSYSTALCVTHIEGYVYDCGARFYCVQGPAVMLTKPHADAD